MRIPVVATWAVADDSVPPLAGSSNSAQRVAAVRRRHALEVTGDLDGGPVVLGMGIYGNPTAVVGDAYRVVVVDRDFDGVTVPRERLVNGVVNDFVNEVMQPSRIGRTDIHRRTGANGLKPL